MLPIPYCVKAMLAQANLPNNCQDGLQQQCCCPSWRQAAAAAAAAAVEPPAAGPAPRSTSPTCWPEAAHAVWRRTAAWAGRASPVLAIAGRPFWLRRATPAVAGTCKQCVGMGWRALPADDHATMLLQPSAYRGSDQRLLHLAVSLLNVTARKRGSRRAGTRRTAARRSCRSWRSGA